MVKIRVGITWAVFGKLRFRVESPDMYAEKDFSPVPSSCINIRRKNINTNEKEYTQNTSDAT